MVAITNDIYTVEDAQFLSRNKALPEDRIMGVETEDVHTPQSVMIPL